MRIDHKVIYEIIDQGASVLDLGCGDGELLHYLADEKQVRAQSIEFDEEKIYQCVEKGLSVFHSDIDSGLSDYPDRSFDYVILNQSMQETKRVDYVIQEALRVGIKVIVGFPNFAAISARSRLFFKGKTPINKALPYHWYDTPNLHFLSISDFKTYCRKKSIEVLKAFYLRRCCRVIFLPNIFALNAVFLISKK